MAVVYKGEIEGRRWAQNNKGVRSYRRSFRLITTAKSDNAYAVGSDANLPVIGSLYPSDATAYCHNITIENTEPWSGWTATYEYSNERQLDSQEPGPGAVAIDETLVSFTSEIYKEVAWRDESGNAILNSAGDYFIDPPPERDTAQLIARISSHQLAIPTWILSYQDAVNSASCNIGGLTVAAGLAKVMRIEVGEREKRFTINFYPLVLEIHIRRDGWKLRPLDAGFRQRDDNDELVQITNDGDGQQPTTPVPLDGSGKVLVDPTPENAVFQTFTIYPELPFNLLPGIS